MIRTFLFVRLGDGDMWKKSCSLDALPTWLLKRLELGL